MTIRQFLCRHQHMQYTRIKGVLMFACEDCPYTEPAIQRGQRESRLVRSGDQAGTLQAQRVQPQVSEKVTQIRRRG